MKKHLRFTALSLSAAIAATTLGSLYVPASTAEAAEISQSDARATASPSGVIYADSRTDFRDESIYFLITTRFYDGDPSNNEHCSEDKKANNPDSDPAWRGDFKGLIDKLDYIKALGFTAIWITPVVENDSGYDYHGYHAYNFSAVDNRYESNGITYQDLIDACHEKGIKVIQDVVLNHTCNWGEENLLQLTSDIYTERNQTVMNGANDPENIYHHNGFCGGADYDTYDAQIKTIADDCFDLETENPKVYEYLVDCYEQYIDMGVDAFRVDTTKHLSRLTLNSVFVPAFKEAGGDDFYMFGEVCTKGHDVWYRNAPPISTCFYTWADDESWTGRWSDSLESNEALVEEHYYEHMDTNNQPTSDNAFLYGNEYHEPDYSEKSGLDVIDFQMHWSFNDANSAFNTALGEDKYFNDSTWNVVYVDSHDYAPDQCQTVRYNGGTDAWAENLSLMFTFRGIPCIYYGSEIEFQAGKPIDVGPNAPLSQTGRAYYGDNIEGDVVTTDFGEYFGATGTMAETLNAPLSRHIQRLNQIRQAVPALRKGQYSTEDISGNNMAYKRRYTDDKTDSFALITVSGTATFNNIPNGTYVDCVTGDTKKVTNGSLTAECSGKGNMRVYVLDTEKTPAPGKIGQDGIYLYTDNPVENTSRQCIYFKNEAGWSSVTANLFSNGTLVESIPMSYIEDQDYACAYTGDADNLTVVFTDGNSVSASADFKDGGYYGNDGYIKQYQIGEDVVEVTSVELSEESLDLTMGETATVKATVLPENAKNKALTWTSSDSDVATVNNKGVITPQGDGTAVITATSNNGISVQLTVKVTVPPYDYEAVPEGKTAIYFEKPSGWGSNINCYLYYGDAVTIAGAWPGAAMEKLPNGVYRYVFDTPDTDETVKVLFNDGSNQAPASVGYDVTAHGKYDSSGLNEVIVPKGDEDPEQKLTVSLSAEKVSPQAQGTTVKLTASAEGGTGKLQYRFYRIKDDVTTVFRDYSTSTVAYCNPPQAGDYTIYVDARDEAGNTSTAQLDFTWDAPENSIVIKSFEASKVSPQVLGSTVKLTASASGGDGTLQYCFYRVKDGVTTVFRDYAASNVAYCNPSDTGVYELYVDVRDENGKTATKKMEFSWNSSENTLKLDSISVSKKSPQPQGSTVILTANASGGTGKLQYRFYRTVNGRTTVFRDYSTSNVAYCNPPEPGNYTIMIDVKDEADNVVTKSIAYKWE